MASSNLIEERRKSTCSLLLFTLDFTRFPCCIFIGVKIMNKILKKMTSFL